jgi:hypothetical protein
MRYCNECKCKINEGFEKKYQSEIRCGSIPEDDIRKSQMQCQILEIAMHRHKIKEK